MQKFWKISDSKSNKLIFIKDKTIYKGNPKREELNTLNSESTNLEFLKNLFNIPYSYIRKVENQLNKDEIKIYYGNDSEEELKIKDRNTKKEVFEFLKAELSEFKYTKETPNFLRYGKAQFFALFITTGIFIWSLHLALEIESGVQYELNNKGVRIGISGIVLAIASLGKTKIIFGYTILLGIIIMAIKKRIKSRSEIEFLKR